MTTPCVHHPLPRFPAPGHYCSRTSHHFLSFLDCLTTNPRHHKHFSLSVHLKKEDFMYLLFREMGREREGEIHWSVASRTPPTGGLAGDPGTFWFWGQHPTHWTTPVRTVSVRFISTSEAFKNYNHYMSNTFCTIDSNSLIAFNASLSSVGSICFKNVSLWVVCSSQNSSKLLFLKSLLHL